MTHTSAVNKTCRKLVSPVSSMGIDQAEPSLENISF